MHLAHELKDTNIKVNAAHPGFVKTALHGVDAPMSADEGAATSVMLATLGGEGPTGSFFHGSDVQPCEQSGRNWSNDMKITGQMEKITMSDG